MGRQNLLEACNLRVWPLGWGDRKAGLGWDGRAEPPTPGPFVGLGLLTELWSQKQPRLEAGGFRGTEGPKLNGLFLTQPLQSRRAGAAGRTPEDSAMGRTGLKLRVFHLVGVWA